MQTLCPLFGEYSTDQAISRAAAHQGGVTAKPVLVATENAGAYTIGLAVNAARGFWAWRTAWEKTTGASLIVEDATVVFATGVTLPTGQNKRHILLVGRWKWTPGQIGGNGKPLGTFTEAQKAIYEAVSGADSATPVDPGVAVADAAGRKAVVLARVVLSSTGATIEWLPETMIDLAEMGLETARKHNRTGDERHVGKFKVSESPVDEEDVVRLEDVRGGMAKPYANISQFAANIGATQYFIEAQVPVKLGLIRSSGINVEPLTGGGWRAKAKGIYRIDYVVKQWGSPTKAYQWAALGVKTALNPGAGFVQIVKERSFFGNGTAEAFQQMTWTLDLEENDIIGLFTVSEAPSIGFVYVTIENLGDRAATDPLAINTVNQTWMAANGQVFPKIVTFNLSAANAMGAITWSIQGGTAQAFSTISGGAVTVNFAEVGAFTLNVRAVDAGGNIANKTIGVTLTAFEVIPLVITNVNRTFQVDSYPFGLSLLLASTGGEAPITWSIVAGANTTLPSPSIVSGRLISSLPNADTWTVEIQATDSAGTPQVVNKTLTIVTEDYIEPPPDPCFEEDTTWILMADRTAKLLRDVMPGDEVACVLEAGHLKGHTTIRSGLVTDKTRNPGKPEDPGGVFVDGVHATPGHAYAVPFEFRRAQDLQPGDTLFEPAGEKVVGVQVGEVKQAPPLRVRGNLGITGGTYFVGASEDGPFRLVHNAALYEWCY